MAIGLSKWFKTTFLGYEEKKIRTRDEDGKYDLIWLLKWKIIVICYDNDKAGRDGALKLKNELMKVANNG